MRIVVAPDKFKGSLEATDVVEHLAVGIRSVEPSATVVAVPVADGGEGTLDAAVGAGFVACSTTVTGPAGNPVEAGFALLDRTAVVEMAAVSGLEMLAPDDRSARMATSRGLGEVVAHALDRGARTLVLGIGAAAAAGGPHLAGAAARRPTRARDPSGVGVILR